MDKNKKGLIILIYKILTAILLGVNVLLAYNLNVSHNINIEATQKLQEQDRIINELNIAIKGANKELEEIIEKLQSKELAVVEVEEIKYAEAEHKEIEKHLGESFYYVDVKCTAYTVGDGLTPSDTMADGTLARVGCVAYNDVPLGTKVEIDGVVYMVCDRVGSDGVLDIYMDTIDECFDFGVQYKTVKVYNE